LRISQVQKASPVYLGKDYGVVKIIKLGIAFNKKRVEFLQCSEEV